jgi:hypothetical protein
MQFAASIQSCRFAARQSGFHSTWFVVVACRITISYICNHAEPDAQTTPKRNDAVRRGWVGQGLLLDVLILVWPVDLFTLITTARRISGGRWDWQMPRGEMVCGVYVVVAS